MLMFLTKKIFYQKAIAIKLLKVIDITNNLGLL